MLFAFFILFLAFESTANQEGGIEVKKDDLTQDLKVLEYLSELKQHMKDTPNPLIATYKGSDLGDYFHFVFKDSTGKFYNFGGGNNNLGGLSFGEDDYEGNSDLVGKQFIISWDWKVSSFPCCGGDLTVYKAKIPGITAIVMAN